MKYKIMNVTLMCSYTNKNFLSTKVLFIYIVHKNGFVFRELKGFVAFQCRQ